MRKAMWILPFLLFGSISNLYAENFLTKKQVKLGDEVADFELPTTRGDKVRLSSFKGKIVMIHFWSAKCPFVARYEDRIQNITKDYEEKNVKVIGIDSNSNETFEQIREAANKSNINYPLLIDEGNKIADQFGAITTPHVYIIDKEGKLAYEGAIDDQGWDEKNTAKHKYVREALDALTAKSPKPVPFPETKTFGCTIKRKE
jgi:peroxiredoxin